MSHVTYVTIWKELQPAPGAHCIDEHLAVFLYRAIFPSSFVYLFYLLFDTVGTLVIWQVMSTNPPYPPSSNQPPYPSQQPMSQYPPPAMMNYGSAYPPPSNQATYPPPVETVASNPAFPPPPTYESAVGTEGKPAAPHAYGNYSYQTQPIPPPGAQPLPPTYSSPDVEYGASEFSAIVSFSDKSIRLGRVVLLWSVKTVQVVQNVLYHQVPLSKNYHVTSCKLLSNQDTKWRISFVSSIRNLILYTYSLYVLTFDSYRVLFDKSDTNTIYFICTNKVNIWFIWRMIIQVTGYPFWLILSAFVTYL